MAVQKVLWMLVGTFLVFPSVSGDTGNRKFESVDDKFNVPGERPFDAVNIFGDLGKSFRLPNKWDNAVWWERMVRGTVGKDRFLILCALKDGNWRKLGEIRDYVEFQIRESYSLVKFHKMLVLMSGRPNFRYANRTTKNLRIGEGWLEKNREADFGGLDSQWRIAPSVIPLLYFLLMSCPEDARCIR